MLGSPPPPPWVGKPAVVLIGHVPNFKPRLEARADRGNEAGRLKEEESLKKQWKGREERSIDGGRG